MAFSSPDIVAFRLRSHAESLRELARALDEKAKIVDGLADDIEEDVLGWKKD